MKNSSHSGGLNGITALWPRWVQRYNTLMIVVKIGGSLFDLPDLRSRLVRVLAPLTNIHIISGGGAMADIVRDWDRLHHLGEEASHWLAVRAMSLSADLLQTIIGQPVIDIEPWLRVHDAIPQTWTVTSDSIALHYAITMQAERILILKSIDMPTPYDWPKLVAEGSVDEYFPTLVEQCVKGPIVEFINLRSA